MNWFNYAVLVFTSVVTIYIELCTYSRLSRNELLKISLKSAIVILLSGILVVINTYTNSGYSRTAISFSLLLISSVIIFDDKISKSCIYTLFCYILVMFYDILFSVLIYQLNIIDMSTFDDNVYLKMIFSFIIIAFVLITANINVVKRIVNKIVDKLNNNLITVSLFIISFFVLIIIDVKYSMTFSYKVYLGNIIIMISVLFLLIASVYNYIKASKEMEKSEILLNFMSKYEKIIDNNRINRHEMLNNLLMLKSINNKNSIDFNEVLDELITHYSKNGIGIKNINKLPTGLKGLFYYKLNDLDEKGYDIRINISKQISSSLKKFPHKKYVILYKMLGIVLDNAIEASSLSKEKYLGIDIYKEDKNIVIVVDNTFKGKINIDKINEKNYSTKGKNRGLGLYIIKNILKNENDFDFQQTIDGNIFSTKIVIK